MARVIVKRARKTPSKTFTAFAVVMVGFLILGTFIVFAGSVFGGGGSSDDQGSQSGSETDNASQYATDQITALETAVADDPTDIGSTKVLANILANSGRVSESLQYFERAVQAEPDDDSLRLAYGIALFRSGSAFDAEVQLKKALELNPDRPDPAYYLGQVNENKAEPDLNVAREWYQKAIEIDPESLAGTQAEQRLQELEAAAPTPQE